MIVEKNDYFVTRLKGEAEAYFKTRTEAEEYEKQYKEFEELKHADIVRQELKKLKEV